MCITYEIEKLQFNDVLISTEDALASYQADPSPLIKGPSGNEGDLTSYLAIDENKKTVHIFSANEPVTWSLSWSVSNNQSDVSEFVIDFISVMPGSPKNKVKSRIIITPQHAKKLSKALNDNIKRFEDNFGSIKNYDNPKFQLNFGPTGEA